MIESRVDKKDCPKIREGFGESHSQSKLKQKDIEFIRLKKGILTGVKLSKMFGVSKSTISLILNNKRWDKPTDRS